MKNDFAKHLTRFFTSYLSGECGLSHNTIRAYGNTFLSFIDFMEKTRRIKADRLSLEHLTRDNVSDFFNGRKKTKGAAYQHVTKGLPHSILSASICCTVTSSIWNNGNPYCPSNLNVLKNSQ